MRFTTTVAASAAPFRHRLAQQAALALAGSALIALAARAQVPMWPVPMTLQTLAVLVLALGCGARIAGGSVALYMAEGAAGLPVFASGGGLAYFAGPTAGYLFGCLAAALAVGALADRGWAKHPAGGIAAALLGAAIVYLLGWAWLALHVGAAPALAGGVLPFLPGDAVKSVIAGLAAAPAARLLRSLAAG